jgi:hypothetical protein
MATPEANDPLGRVGHVEPILQGRLSRLPPLLLHGGDPRLRARPRVRRDERQRTPVAQGLRPGRPRAIVVTKPVKLGVSEPESLRA